MKKKIALLLAAALLSFGLIVSCSDDPEPEEPTNPGTPAVKYTVAFDANGGELAAGTKIVLTVESGKTVGTANWPDDPVKTSTFDYGVAEDDFNGWFDGTTKYVATTPITKDVTLVASYSPFVRPERSDDYVTALGWFTWENNTSTQRGWRANGADNTETSLDWADIAEARYLVLHTKSGYGKDWTTGFGGIQVVAQGDGSNWGWDQTNINSFYIPRANDKDVFIAIDITTLKNYTKLVRGTIGKILVSYYDGVTNSTGLGLQEAYLTNIDLKPKSSVLLGSNQNKVSGFATDDDVLKLLGVTLPTNTKKVTFDINYTDTGVTSPAAVVVETNKPLNLKYRDVSRPNHTFLGWFDGSAVTTISVADQKADGFKLDTTVAAWGKKYDYSTAIAADVSLKAGWLEQDWPELKNAEKVEAENGQWSGLNEKDPFPIYFIVASKGTSGDGFGGIQFALNGADVDNIVRTTGNWTGLAHTNDDIVFFVIDLRGWTEYDTWKAASWAQFRINYGGNNLGNYQGYYSAVSSLTKPDGAVDFKLEGDEDKPVITGYVTKTLPAELK